MTLLAMRRERCPTRVMLLVMWIRVWCTVQDHVLCDAAGYAVQFSTCGGTVSRACACAVLRVALTHRSLASCRAICLHLLRPLPDLAD